MGGNTADTVSSGATAGQSIFQGPAFNSSTASPVQWTFSVWLKAAANTPAVLVINRTGGADQETQAITVTNAWQRFAFTHSATWTGVGAIVAAITITNASSSIFAWGAQLEYGGAMNAYVQSAGSPGSATSGNGTIGTPESRFAVRTAPPVDHEQHQNAIGQRGLSLTPIFRVVPVTLNMGNNTAERVSRILTFLCVRKLGLRAAPYVAPWTGKVTCFMDAVDTQNRPLIAQLCGDIITVDPTVTEEYQADYEILKAVYNVPAFDGQQPSGPATIELTLLQYLAAAFSDTSLTAQQIRASIPAGLAPLAAVDSTGIQRLRGAFANNPVNANGILTGNNPVSQSGTSTTILVASCTIQFGDGQVSYNSGSVNPGAYGKYAIYCIDPTFAGGAVTFLATQSTHIKTSDNGIIVFGVITTSAGGGGTGTGGGSGSGDNSGGDVLPTR